MAQATDSVGFQDAAAQGLHSLSPEVQRAAIITIAILGRSKSPYGAEIREKLRVIDQPRLLLEAVKYVGFAHDDLAIPDLIRLNGGGSAEVVGAAYQSLEQISGVTVADDQKKEWDWQAWYSKRQEAVGDLVQAVRVAYGHHDRNAEIQAVRELFTVADLSTTVLDALADLNQHDPGQGDHRTVAAQGITRAPVLGALGIRGWHLRRAARERVRQRVPARVRPRRPRGGRGRTAWQRPRPSSQAGLDHPRRDRDPGGGGLGGSGRASKQVQTRPAAMLIRRPAGGPAPRPPQAARTSGGTAGQGGAKSG